jgi:hypothetical protein
MAGELFTKLYMDWLTGLAPDSDLKEAIGQLHEFVNVKVSPGPCARSRAAMAEFDALTKRVTWLLTCERSAAYGAIGAHLCAVSFARPDCDAMMCNAAHCDACSFLLDEVVRHHKTSRGTKARLSAAP